MTEVMEFYIQNPAKAEAMGAEARKRLQEATVDKIFEQWKLYILKTLKLD